MENTKNSIYKWIEDLLVKLYESGKQIQTSKLMEMVNQRFINDLDHPYASLRGVPQAVWRRCGDNEKEAIENTLLNCKGQPLLY